MIKPKSKLLVLSMLMAAMGSLTVGVQAGIITSSWGGDYVITTGNYMSHVFVNNTFTNNGTNIFMCIPGGIILIRWSWLAEEEVGVDTRCFLRRRRRWFNLYHSVCVSVL